ncbi:unnamed protein product [Porites evermanni]|uniref:Cyclin-F n=1 Tax=Porites evermanni TaxID=104178 RepID=A0ABN8QSY0_9CNID|nr:unnamed protein product [Porites evermanni]
MKLRNRIPTRARPSRCSLLALPEEVVLLILKRLTANELMCLRMVCSRLKSVIDDSPTLWVSASFLGVWPSLKNLPLLKRAAGVGNPEALIKLGLAHLYNEGISENGDKGVVNAKENGCLAAEFFFKAECNIPNGAPFTWFFVRPPWAPSGVCCKSCVFSSMVELSSNSSVNKSVLYCVGKILSLHEDEIKKEESLGWLKNAASQGSSHAAFELWKMRYCQGPLEPYSRLERLRELRDCAKNNHPDAQLTLALEYAQGNLGGVTKSQVAEFISQFVSRSKAQNSHKLFSFQTELNSTMRYILVDWLVEVAVMKDFPSQIVHIAVSCVDKYLMRRKVQRSELQLLGITCMLVAARFQGTDIVTIREAAWLTDGTYKYEEVVRMMGEVMSCIKGQVRVLTIPDFLKLFCSLAAVSQKTECIAGYVGDLSILHTECGRFSPALTAASAVLLANSIQQIENPWPQHMCEITGLGVVDLLDCTLHLHQQCLLDDYPVDHRNVKLKAIKERYLDERFMKVSEIKVPAREELRQYILPIARQSAMQSGKRCLVTGRTKSAARETGQIHQGGVDDSVLNTSVGSLSESGYDGDMEDEGDLNADEMLDEELCSEFDDQGVLNKQSKDSSFLNWDEFTRTSSTPSILYPNGSQNGFDFEVQEMETDPEPVLIDSEIHSANELCIPVALEADDTMDLEESCSISRSSNVQRRQPLRAIENGNIPARAPISLKSQQRSSAWSRSTTH